MMTTILIILIIPIIITIILVNSWHFYLPKGCAEFPVELFDNNTRCFVHLFSPLSTETTECKATSCTH